jgi:Ca2+-binding EF-hand superfamily protein
MDQNNSGEIDYKELMSAYENQNQMITEDEAKEIISKMDYDQNGKINYSQYFTAAFDHTYYLSAHYLK